MKILVACEESQAVTIELRRLGHEAFSCDILPCSGHYPEWHLQDDAMNVLRHDIVSVFSCEWDMVIAFPPCTDLAVSGARWFKEKQADGRQQKSIAFFEFFTYLKNKHVAIENPIGIMSTLYRKPDQIIQPYEYGSKSRKATCLWLKGLPKLKPTDIVEPEIYTCKNGKTFSKDYMVALSAGKNRGHLRSKTYPGIAKAMATQWSNIYPMQQSLWV